jgi:hypothetical protein
LGFTLMLAEADQALVSAFPAVLDSDVDSWLAKAHADPEAFSHRRS